MAQINRLSARKVATVHKPGRYGDGGNLYLRVAPGGSKQWMFLYRWHGKPTEIGLGGGRARELAPLAKAREIASQYRAMLAQGINPKDAKKPPVSTTFGECADKVIEEKKQAREANGRPWSAKHLWQWEQSMKDHAAALRPHDVAKIDTDKVLEVLKPHWKDRQVTAGRLRSRIETVLDWAKAKGLRQGENVARWRGHLEHLLTERGAQPIHHAAMDYYELPAFMIELQKQQSLAARALQFIILTASRSGEALKATWQEIDFERGIWTIPGSRMKAGKEHRVPLSEPVLAILKALHEVRLSDLVFAGLKPNRPLTGMTIHLLLDRMKIEGITIHGFRSCFSDWAHETTTHQSEVIEMCLAHAIENRTERAYRRGDLFAKRTEAMTAWANFCTGQAGKVIHHEFGRDAKRGVRRT